MVAISGAQKVTGYLLGVLWPQQANQGAPSMRTVRFYRQIDQKRTDLVRFEGRNRRIVYQDLQWAQHAQG